MKRALGLDFAKQALVAFLCLSFTHWVVNLSSYVRRPPGSHALHDAPPRGLTLQIHRRASAATRRRCRTAT